MSAPLELTAEELGLVSEFLHLLTKATATTGVELDRAAIDPPGATGSIDIRWDPDIDAYRLDDRVGT